MKIYGNMMTWCEKNQILISLPGARKIYQRKQYTIYQVRNGYIIHNINKDFEKGHTHVKSFHKAKSLIDLCVRSKLPNKPINWEIERLLRISNDKRYKNKLQKLIGGDNNEY